MNDPPSESTSTPSTSDSASENPSVDRMFQKIIHSPNAFFKHQQKGDPDLQDAEKYSVCSELYHQHPVQFLARYSQFLDSGDSAHFRNRPNVNGKSISADDQYELNYYLQDMDTRKSTAAMDIQHPDPLKKNRRYCALKRLIADGEYFSDYETRSRDPLLYDQMIGQYQTEREQQAAFHSGDRQATVFSTILLDMFDATELSKRRNQQLADQAMQDRRPPKRKANVDSDEEEFETDEEEEDTNYDITGKSQGKKRMTTAEKMDLREDFMREMHERFLDGRDTDFDYSTVDNNPDYDSMDLQTRDHEDRYFDEEEPQENHDENDMDRHES